MAGQKCSYSKLRCKFLGARGPIDSYGNDENTVGVDLYLGLILDTKVW